MSPEQAEAGRIGIELLTAWSASDESDHLFRDRRRVLLDETPLDDSLVLLMAAVGLADVAGFLLLMLSEVTGLTGEEILQEIAQRSRTGTAGT